ncbi:uncharacterized protein [Triticum aestivum]|uniref:uncharacterized protein isoform X1 n=1 Tax=Triticum aestivum TaxID=4565 RepID=UPI001D004C1D|nr:uncharacterized protein LOC123070170 isoform X1 [Triticum aestivum]
MPRTPLRGPRCTDRATDSAPPRRLGDGSLLDHVGSRNCCSSVLWARRRTEGVGANVPHLSCSPPSSSNSAIQKLVCSLVTTDVRLTSIRCTSVLLWVQFMSAPAMTAAMQCTPVVAVVHSGGRCGIAQWLASSLVMQLGDVPGAVS